MMANIYLSVLKLLGLSILQNGPIPKFFDQVLMDEIFNETSPQPSIIKLQNGLAKLGIYQIVRRLPIMKYLFLPSEYAILTVKKLVNCFKPVFSAEGSNNFTLEKSVYSALLKYIRETASTIIC